MLGDKWSAEKGCSLGAVFERAQQLSLWVQRVRNNDHLLPSLADNYSARTAFLGRDAAAREIARCANAAQAKR